MPDWRQDTIRVIVTIAEVGGFVAMALMVLALSVHGIRWAFALLQRTSGHDGKSETR